MPKYYCEYCDIFLTHDSITVRRSHNAGKNHKLCVRNYYENIIRKEHPNLLPPAAGSGPTFFGLKPVGPPGGTPMIMPVGVGMIPGPPVSMRPPFQQGPGGYGGLNSGGPPHRNGGYNGGPQNGAPSQYQAGPPPQGHRSYGQNQNGYGRPSNFDNNRGPPAQRQDSGQSQQYGARPGPPLSEQPYGRPPTSDMKSEQSYGGPPPSSDMQSRQPYNGPGGIGGGGVPAPYGAPVAAATSAGGPPDAGGMHPDRARMLGQRR